MPRTGFETDHSSSLGTNLTRFREPEDGVPQSYKRVKLDESLEGALAGRDANLNLFSSVVPLDLVGEICRHLSPLDLLNWSRSSKQFRRIFFNRSISSSWWRNARRNDGIPDLKWEVAEPAYASLLFDNYCMIGPISVELVQKCYVSFPEWEKIRKDIKVILEIVEEQAAGEAEEYLSEVNWEDRQDEISSRRDSLAAAQPNEVLKYTFPNSEQFLRLNSIKQLLEEDVEIDDERWDSFSEEIDADVLSYQQNLVNVYYKVAKAFFDQDPTARRFLSTQSVFVEPNSEDWEREIAFLVRFDYLIHFICSPDDYGPTCEFTDNFPNFCGHVNDATSDSITVVNRRAEIVLELINSTSRLVNNDSIDSSKLDNLGQSFKCNLCRDSDLTFRWNSIVEHFLIDHKGSSVVGEIQFEDSEGK
ncbi:hypothetical protein JCM5350_007689 [Sporobolomyces pararoseus]